MKLIIAGILLTILNINTCVTSWGQNAKDEEAIFVPQSQPVPNAKYIGTIKLGNNGTKIHCQYDELVMKAKNKAVTLGGNIVKLKELTPPYFISPCYKIIADVYHIDNLEEYKTIHHLNNAIAKQGADGEKYATLYIYRLADTTTFAPSYYLHLEEDSVLGSIKGKSNYTLRLYKEGATNLWAKTEQKVSITINAQHERSYYLRCGTVRGSFKMIPVLELVDSTTGAKEYNKLIRKDKYSNVNYLSAYH